MRFGWRNQIASMTKPRILVVAADAALRASLARWLLAAGYAIELAESLKRARETAESTSIALAIVAPDGLGAAAAEQARDLGSHIEHLMVIEEEAGATSTAPKIQGDDILSRPLSEPVVLARIKSILGTVRNRERQAGPELLRFEGYTLDAAGRTCVDASGQQVALTRAEFSLLLALARQPGRVLSRDELSQAVAGRDAEPDDRSVDVLMSRLRRKIEPDPKTPRIIVTLPGEGYKFTARPQVIVPPNPMTASPSFAVAPGQDAATRDAQVQGTEFRETEARTVSIMRTPQAVLAVVLVVTTLGWLTWSNRAALRPPVAVTPAAISPPPQSQPGASEEVTRATIFKRMVATMQDSRFDWRTIERLAVEAGVSEAEAHEILAEHPDEVVLGESRDGKLIARLSKR
jgi:DNA-binding response OmpR family regulator